MLHNLISNSKLFDYNDFIIKTIVFANVSLTIFLFKCCKLNIDTEPRFLSPIIYMLICSLLFYFSITHYLNFDNCMMTYAYCYGIRVSSLIKIFLCSPHATLILITIALFFSKGGSGVVFLVFLFSECHIVGIIQFSVFILLYFIWWFVLFKKVSPLHFMSCISFSFHVGYHNCLAKVTFYYHLTEGHVRYLQLWK